MKPRWDGPRNLRNFPERDLRACEAYYERFKPLAPIEVAGLRHKVGTDLEDKFEEMALTWHVVGTPVE